MYILSREAVLVDDDCEHVFQVGDSAGFKAGVRNVHHFINRSAADVVFLTVGSRNDADFGDYPDIDLKFLPGRYSGGGGFSKKDGSRY